MKVVVDNLQKIKHGEFEFPVGLTIIVGRNGSGKTALFRGIDGLLTNKSGTAGYISHGQPECRVTIENNGNSVTWVRTKSSSEYIDNNTGKNYPKASKLDSRDIADLGFYFDRKGKIVNIHDEWSIIFPFGESDTELFKIFEDIFGISNSANIVDELKKDEAECKRSIEQINIEYDQNKQVIAQIDRDVELINPQVCLQLGKDIKVYDDTVGVLADELVAYKDLKDKLERVVPDISSLDSLMDEIHQLDQSCSEMKADLIHLSQSTQLKNNVIPELNLTLFSIEDVDIPLYEYKTYSNEIKIQTEKIEQYESEINEIQEKLSQIKVCPTCGRPME